MPDNQDVYNIFQNEKCFRHTEISKRYGISHYLDQVDRLNEDIKRYGENFPHCDVRQAEIRQMTYDTIQMMVDHHESEAITVLEQALNIHLQPSKKPVQHEWTLRHKDSFDGSGSLDTCGTVLLSGLIQLWRHVLRESIRDTGETKFSDFQLIWSDGKTHTDIEIKLDSQKNPTLAKIRRWVYPPTVEDKDLPVEKWKYEMDGRLEDYPLLVILGRIHLLLIRFGRLNTKGYIDPGQESVVLLGFITPMFSAHQLRLLGAVFPSQGY